MVHMECQLKAPCSLKSDYHKEHRDSDELRGCRMEVLCDIENTWKWNRDSSCMKTLSFDLPKAVLTRKPEWSTT